MIDISMSLPTTDSFRVPDQEFRVSWAIVSDILGDQEEFEVQVSPTRDFSELIERIQGDTPDQFAVIPGSAVGPRDERFIRVRVRIGETWSDWSESTFVEGALRSEDWLATGITMPDDRGEVEQAPSPLLRRSFHIDGAVQKARLHVTSLGINHVVINGEKVSDELFNPGWTSYHKRLLAASYDVTHLLREGENVIGAMLGDGWYRGRLGWDPVDTRGRYGRQLALVAQLEVTSVTGKSFRIVTDGDWKAATGHVLLADFYDGCIIDLRAARPGWEKPGFDDSAWVPAKPVEFDASIVRHRASEPVRKIDNWPVKPEKRSDGSFMLDGGQNISGFVRLRVVGKRGDQIVVRHAEVLNPDGSLHTRALRSAKATDRYVLAGSGEVELEPMFTFHGFRYAMVESKAEIVAAEYVAISSDLRRRGTFRCSHEGLNQLHENVFWSLRDNFVAIPTDCPQRDERLGWTGDAQAFAATSATLVHGLAFWRSWLEDLALDQHPDLGPPAVVPDVVLDEPMRFGRAGWADAATIVPWALYESYGDIDVLERQYESMRSWVANLQGRLEPDGLLPESPQFGDWLDPDAPSDKPWDAKVDSTFIANAFFAYSASLLERASEALYRSEEVILRYRDLAESIRRATWARWEEHIETTQSGCAIALETGVVPENQRRRIAEALGDLTRQAGGRVSTGFLGTPLVLPALAREGLYDEAYMMLLCRESPSWLYQVDHDATTTWERWDAIRPDGSIHPGDMSPPPGATEGGHMLSFNHYAYGAVVDWIYRHLGGIAPDPEDPGYRSVQLRPRPPAAVDWAKTSIDTHYGKVEMTWSVKDDMFEATVTIPFGISGRFEGPLSARSEQTVDGRPCAGTLELLPGTHQIRISVPRLAAII